MSKPEQALHMHPGEEWPVLIYFAHFDDLPCETAEALLNPLYDIWEFLCTKHGSADARFWVKVISDSSEVEAYRQRTGIAFNLGSKATNKAERYLHEYCHLYRQLVHRWPNETSLAQEREIQIDENEVMKQSFWSDFSELVAVLSTDTGPRKLN